MSPEASRREISIEDLCVQITQLFDSPPERYTEHDIALFAQFKSALNYGKVRAAEPDTTIETGWRVNSWVKKGILLGFRMGSVVDQSVHPSRMPFFDKATYPLKPMSAADGVRIVPGGSSIRDGVFIGRGVTCMPPMFVNVGAYVGEGTSRRFARAGRKLRANRTQLPPQRCRANWRGSRTSRRSPCHY